MKDKSEDYVANGGWSSALFAQHAIPLMSDLKDQGVQVTVGRSVIHIGKKLKAYVHHNGRTAEFATITDWKGVELDTFHHTDFVKLAKFIKLKLGDKNENAAN